MSADPADATGTGPATGADVDPVAAVPVSALADRLRAVGLACDVIGDGDVTLGSVTHDSRAVDPGALFACLRGDAFDGHLFASDAVRSGARALLVDHRLDVSRDVTQLVVADTRRAVGPLAALVAGDPSRRITTVGITGTNGKTTTAQLVASILDEVGRSTGVIGTLHGPRTTPEAADLQRRLAGFVDDGMSAAVMEVSSHALALHRVDGTSFDVVAFTNFGHDHLDLHGTPEEYFRAKSLLFDARFAPVAVIDVDDPHGRVLADVVADRSGADALRVVEVSLSDVSDVEVDPGEHRYTWRGVDVVVPIGGDFNVSNSLLALTIATELGIEPERAAAAIAGAAAVPGRFERVATDAGDRRGISVIVDYAHTPDGLERLLESARDAVPAGCDVVVVFGCGGERDRPKRPQMGAVAARLADRVVVTSDNPRREDPLAIIDDILGGVPDDDRARTSSNPDRRAAIDEALASARPGDLVVIAGKGHETTQDLGDRIVDFDDRIVVRSLLGDRPERARPVDPAPSPDRHEDTP